MFQIFQRCFFHYVTYVTNLRYIAVSYVTLGYVTWGWKTGIRGVITTRHCANPRLPYHLPYRTCQW